MKTKLIAKITKKKKFNFPHRRWRDETYREYGEVIIHYKFWIATLVGYYSKKGRPMKKKKSLTGYIFSCEFKNLMRFRNEVINFTNNPTQKVNDLKDVLCDCDHKKPCPIIPIKITWEELNEKGR